MNKPFAYTLIDHLNSNETVSFLPNKLSFRIYFYSFCVFMSTLLKIIFTSIIRRLREIKRKKNSLLQDDSGTDSPLLKLSCSIPDQIEVLMREVSDRLKNNNKP